MISIFSLWQSLLLISIFSNRNRFKRFWQYLRILLGKDEELSILENEISDFELNQIKSSKVDQHKQLIIRPVGDEATMALTVAEFLSWANIFMLKIFSMVSDNSINFIIRTGKDFFLRLGKWFGLLPESEKKMKNGEFILGILSFLIAVPVCTFIMGRSLFPNISLVMEPEGPIFFSWIWEEIGIIGGPIIIVITTIVLAFAVLCILGIISVLSLFFLSLSALPLGLDAVFWSHFTRTTIESTPPGLYDVYVHPADYNVIIDKELSLEHSKIYNEPNVINKIKTWLIKG
jgi:hypothetical protein